MNIKDFKVGQKVYVKLIGNACRGKIGEQLIEEWEVTKVGRKYVTAKCDWREFKFEQVDFYKDCLNQVTDHCNDYLLYLSKETIEQEIEKNRLFREVSELFRGFCIERNFTLEQLRQIKAIMTGEDKNANT